MLQIKSQTGVASPSLVALERSSRARREGILLSLANALLENNVILFNAAAFGTNGVTKLLYAAEYCGAKTRIAAVLTPME